MHTIECVDAVVIGSGFGGSVAALRLGEAGYSTVLLERGKRWPITPEHNTFATYDRPDGRAAWLSETTVDPLHQDVPIERYTGILDRTRGEGITVLSGVGVGGGSLTYTGALIQPERAQFQAILPDLDYDKFVSEYYFRVRTEIRPAPLPADLLSDPHFESTRNFQSWVQRGGLPIEFADMAMDWSLVRQELNGNSEPHLTTGQEMWYGLNSGARLSLDKNYLARAEITYDVDVRPLHSVNRIEAALQPGHKHEHFLVSGQRLATDGSVLESFTIRCNYLFLAAGSVKTSELLVNAKATGTLPRLNAYTGQGWGNNGDVMSFHTGHPRSTHVPQVPGGASTLAEENKETFVRLLGDVDNSSSSSFLSLAMVQPTPGAFPGSFLYDQQTGKVTLHWPRKDPVIAQLPLAVEKMCSRLDAASWSEQSAPLTPGRRSDITMHPLGGMVLGKACDLSGRVLGYNSLYVVDGSLLPGTAGCATPALTIAALAEYVLDRFRKEHASAPFSLAYLPRENKAMV